MNDNMMKATYKAGYMEGHAAGYEKATQEFNIHPRIMDALSKGFLDGWQARQKDIDDLEKQYSKLAEKYRQVCADLAWYKQEYEVYEAVEALELERPI